MFDFDSEEGTPRNPVPVQLATHSSSRLKMHKKTSSSRKRSRSDHNNSFETNRSPEVHQNQNSSTKRSLQKRDKIVQDPRRVSFSKLKKSSTSSYKTSRHFSSPNSNKAMSTSKVEKSSQIPIGISEPRDLCWHVKMPTGKTPQQHLPCFIVKSKQKGISSRQVLDSSDESDSDEEEEVQIQYLSCTSKKKNIYVMPKRLVPFHGRRNNDFDHDDYGRLNWNKEHIKSYLDHLSKHDAQEEKIYLKKVLAEARKRGGYKIKIDGNMNIDKQDVIHIDEEEDESDSSEGSDCDELEEPYTQALPEDFDIDIDDIPIMKKTLNKKSTEPIRPGDIIEYYSPIFGFGDERGRTVATVMSCNPKHDPHLKLHNNDCLPNDWKVKRVKTLEKIDGEHTLIDHPGVFRPIQEFKLVKLTKLPKGYKVETEGERVQKILNKNFKKTKKELQKIGFAPMDMLQNYGQGNLSSDEDGGNNSMSSSSEEGSDSDDDFPSLRKNELVSSNFKKMQSLELTNTQETEQSNTTEMPAEKSIKSMLCSLRDTPDSSDDDDFSPKATKKECSSKRNVVGKKSVNLNCSDSEQENETIKYSQFVRREDQLAALGLSDDDDDIPQSVFSKKDSIQDTSAKMPLEHSMDSNAYSRTNIHMQHYKKGKDKVNYDSEDSMSFKASPSPKQGISNMSRSKQNILQKRYAKHSLSIDSSSDSENSSDDEIHRGLKKLTQRKLKQTEIQSSSKCKKKKPSLQKASLTLSFRKYN